MIYIKQFMIQKGRNSMSSTQWEATSSVPTYLDSAYKQLLRQDHKTLALKNRTKVLNRNHHHALKQIQNNQLKIIRLETVKQNNSLEVKKLRQDKGKKLEQTEFQRDENSRKREEHSRQMSTASLQKQAYLATLKKEVLDIRRQNLKLIELNKENDLQKKKDVRNKIYNDIVESRSTVKQFFINKHSSIVQSTKEEVKRLNEKRTYQQMESAAESRVHLTAMEKELRELKKSVKEGLRDVIPRQNKLPSSKGFKHQVEDTHPLLRRIDNVMSRYTKLT